MEKYIAKLFDQEAYSDVTIKCGELEIKAHKAILCNRLEYFEKLCGEGAKFKESDQNTIELFEDEPSAVRSMIKYLYTSIYHEQPSHRALMNDVLQNPSFYLHVFAVTSKHGFDTLQDLVARDFKDAFVMLDYKNRDLEAGVAALARVCNMFQSPPESLVDILYVRLGTYMDRILALPMAHAELIKVVSTNNQAAEALAEALFKYKQLEAGHLQQCSNCASILGTQQVTCASGQAGYAEADVMPLRYYKLREV